MRITKKGEKEIEGLTDAERPRRLGPKRANTIRKVFALRNNRKEGKVDDVRNYVVKREIKKGDKTFYKSPKIQRLITEKTLRRKSVYKRDKLRAYKKSIETRKAYEEVVSQYIKSKKNVAPKAEPATENAKKPEKQKK